MNGFSSGAISSIAASFWKGGGEHATDSSKKAYGGVSAYLKATGEVGTVLFGTIAGAGGAALSGGNIWQGAASGFIVSAMNHALHGGFAKKYKFKVMLDTKGARDAGHHATAGELDDGTYRFQSKNGTADPNDANYSGPSAFTDKIFNDVQAIQDYYGTKITPGHSFDKIDTYSMTRSQMNRAFATGRFIAEQSYHLFLNSCTNLVTQSLSAAFGKSFFYDTIPRLNHIVQRANYYMYSN